MDEPDSQFLPTSLTCMRRTSTGSLTRKRTSTSQSHDYASCSNHREYAPLRARKTPITVGGSWDDNSVGHGSVAARMRRERNKAIRRTQSTATYTNNPIDTHACVTSTLNLINTTSLSPWKHHERLLWDEDDELHGCQGNPSAAAKRSAGSLCNISSTMPAHNWDSRSIPDYSKMHRRSNFRHSFTSAQYHSSPTSGCASIASSDLDSADLAFFSMNDDSSLFDGDSLFSDTYGVMDTDSGFSSNIFNLLEEGTISCRTPFLNGDWPDSISELDFDCSEQQNDISNCDAHSDIGPSCSVPTDRNKLKKRHVRSKSSVLETDEQKSYATQNYMTQNGEATTDPDIYLTNPCGGSRRKPNAPVTQQTTGDDVMQYVTAQTEDRASVEVATELKLDLGVAGMGVGLALKEGGCDVRADEPDTPVAETKMLLAPEEAQMPVQRPEDTQMPVDALLQQRHQLEQLELMQQAHHSSEIAPDAAPVALQQSCPAQQQQSLPNTQHFQVLPASVDVKPVILCPASQQGQFFVQHCQSSPSNNAGKTELSPLLLQQQQQLRQTAPCEVQNTHRANLYPSTDNAIKKFAATNLDAPVQVQLHTASARHSAALSSKVPIVLNINNWNGMPQEERLGFIEQLSERINRTMGLQEQLEIVNIIGAGNNHNNTKEQTNESPVCVSIDDIDSHKLSRVFGYLDNGKTEDSPTKSEEPPKPPETNLRRSNSDGNLPKTVTDAQKEHRRRQRQARKWAKLMKQRQRKENRQLMKEHKSGLFVNEKKVKIAVATEEDVDVTDI